MRAWTAKQKPIVLISLNRRRLKGWGRRSVMESKKNNSMNKLTRSTADWIRLLKARVRMYCQCQLHIKLLIKGGPRQELCGYPSGYISGLNTLVMIELLP